MQTVLKSMWTSEERENFKITLQNTNNKGDLLEEKTREIFEQLGFCITLTKPRKWTKNNSEKGFELTIFGDYGIDLFGTINLPTKQGMIRANIIIQCKCYIKSDIPTDTIRAFDATVSKYPGFIGILLVYDKKKINKRSHNDITNGNAPILIIDLDEIHLIKDQLTKIIESELHQSITTLKPQFIINIEELEHIQNIAGIKITAEKAKNIIITKY